MNNVIYPTPEKIIDYNKFLLKEIKVKKADQPKVLSYLKINDTVEECKALRGSFYDKAVCLLKGLVQKHPFASGNRRTALFTTLTFLKDNNTNTDIKDDAKSSKILTWIREGFYIDKEISNWLKNGKIRKFER